MSDYFVHESSYVDDNVTIGKNTKIWHFCHVQSGAVIGENCSFGQNVNIASNVTIGNGVKVQNNVSIYEGVELEDYVFCGPSMVFTNDLTPRAKYPKGSAGYKKNSGKTGCYHRCKCHCCLWTYYRQLGTDRFRSSCNQECAVPCTDGRSSCTSDWMGL